MGVYSLGEGTGVLGLALGAGAGITVGALAIGVPTFGEAAGTGRPKIFFIQACQGKEPGCGIVESEPHVEKSLVSDGKVQTTDRSDIYISYATVQGNRAFRHTEKGSWYIGAVCKILCEESKQSTLTQLQIFINKQVTEDEDKVYTSEEDLEKFKQQPYASNQLRSNVHFFYGETN